MFCSSLLFCSMFCWNLSCVRCFVRASCFVRCFVGTFVVLDILFAAFPNVRCFVRRVSLCSVFCSQPYVLFDVLFAATCFVGCCVRLHTCGSEFPNLLMAFDDACWPRLWRCSLLVIVFDVVFGFPVLFDVLFDFKSKRFVRCSENGRTVNGLFVFVFVFGEQMFCSRAHLFLTGVRCSVTVFDAIPDYKAPKGLRSPIRALQGS